MNGLELLSFKNLTPPTLRFATHITDAGSPMRDGSLVFSGGVCPVSNPLTLFGTGGRFFFVDTSLITMMLKKNFGFRPFVIIILILFFYLVSSPPFPSPILSFLFLFTAAQN